jgi:hypothetical protein
MKAKKLPFKAKVGDLIKWRLWHTSHDNQYALVVGTRRIEGNLHDPLINRYDIQIVDPRYSDETRTSIGGREVIEVI